MADLEASETVMGDSAVGVSWTVGEELDVGEDEVPELGNPDSDFQITATRPMTSSLLQMQACSWLLPVWPLAAWVPPPLRR